MPTYLRLPRFNRDWDRLRRQEQARFRAALALFVADLAAGSGFRPGLRGKKMAGHDIWEMTWARDGRAPFCYGQPGKDGAVHIILRAGGKPPSLTCPRAKRGGGNGRRGPG